MSKELKFYKFLVERREGGMIDWSATVIAENKKEAKKLMRDRIKKMKLNGEQVGASYWRAVYCGSHDIEKGVKLEDC